MNPCEKCKKKTGCRSCKPKRDWSRHLKKERRKERGMATRDTAERETASRENERSANNAKTD